MMRENQYLRYVVPMVVSCIILCMSMAGCGIRDEAIELPIGESLTEDSGGDNSALPKQEDTSMQSFPAETKTIYVYVCGAVQNPGVYELPEDSRVTDALQAAGGFSEDAGKEYVNLAAKVSDGEQLYFPTEAEAEALKLVEESERNGFVNINTADKSQLMELPGIGEARAQDIIAYREEHGDFRSKEEIMKVPGIKENMYAKLCDRIIVQ